MKISMIGAGAMGGATVEGLLKAGHQGQELCVSDPQPAVLEKFEAMGVVTTTDNRTAAAQADVLMVCVKPWLVQTVLSGISDVLQPQRQLLVVIAAGVSTDSIGQWLGAQCPPLVLCIPNIAIAQRQSMTFLVPATTARQQHTEVVKSLFEEVGHVLITDEQHLAAGTALASCGLAYAMRYIRAASEGGVELGFKADDAKQIVMQTMEGAVKLLEASGMHPEQAIDLVTTPGGLTIKGLNEMEHAGFTSAVVKGLKASMK